MSAQFGFKISKSVATYVTNNNGSNKRMHYSFIILIKTALFLRSVDATGLACTQHPLYYEGLTGTFLRSWKFSDSSPESSRHINSVYLPREPTHDYILQTNTSFRLNSLDLFFTEFDTSYGNHFLTLHFQRPALVYLLIPSWTRMENIPMLDGWKSVQWASLVDDTKNVIEYGVHMKRKMELATRVSVYIRLIEAENLNLDLPSKRWLSSYLSELETSGNFVLLIGEQDGSSPRIPATQSGQLVQQSASCPKWLHDSWIERDVDPNDPDTNEIEWQSWHPLWDPCFWW